MENSEIQRTLTNIVKFLTGDKIEKFNKIMETKPEIYFPSDNVESSDVGRKRIEEALDNMRKIKELVKI